jgi:hypothetical protein
MPVRTYLELRALFLCLPEGTPSPLFVNGASFRANTPESLIKLTKNELAAMLQSTTRAKVGVGLTSRIIRVVIPSYHDLNDLAKGRPCADLSRRELSWRMIHSEHTHVKDYVKIPPPDPAPVSTA